MLREKNIKKEEGVKSEFGNWRRPDDYSERARKEKRKADGEYDHGQDYVQEPPKDVKKRVGTAFYYRNRSTKNASEVAHALMKDVFCIPILLWRHIMEDRDIVPLAYYDMDLYYALEDIGNCGLLYIYKPSAESRALKQAVRIGRRLYLTDQPEGMPVSEYLYYMLAGDRRNGVSAETLEEWSGIPMQMQEHVYRKIIKLLRSCLESIHKEQARYAQLNDWLDAKKEEDAAKEAPAFDQYPFDPDAGNDI